MLPSISIRPVSSPAERRIFLTFPWRIYRRDPLWVPPLSSDRRKTLDPRQGVFFKRGGQAELLIAWRGQTPVGTLCVAEDIPVNTQRGLRDCMVGFFECVEDYAVAEALFGYAVTWARKRSLNTLYGPFNLDYENAYGVLVAGRDRPPALYCGHTPPYYLSFFERFGFARIRGDNLAFAANVDPSQPSLQRIARLAERIRQRGRFTVRGANLADWHADADRVYLLLNRSLAHLTDFIPWQRADMLEMFANLMPIVDPELILFAEAEGQVVGWFPGIPNMNEVLIHANGLRYPWDVLRVIPYRWRKPRCLAVKSVLVLPEYWDTGVAVLLFDEMARRAHARGYQWVDLSLTSEDNPDTPILAGRVGAQEYKRYRVFRYRF